MTATDVRISPGEETVPLARRPRTTSLVVGLLLVAGGATAGTISAPWIRPPNPRTASVQTVTIPIQHRTLTRQTITHAVVSDGTATTVLAGSGARVTFVPKRSGDFSEGTELLELDGAPVVLLWGQRPAWRDMSLGTVGPDVRQFQEALHRLGLRSASANGTWDASTTIGWRLLQKRLGSPDVHDRLQIRDIVFAPVNQVGTVAGEVAVAAGQYVSPGTEVASLFTTAARVVLDLPDGSGLADGQTAAITSDTTEAVQTTVRRLPPKRNDQSETAEPNTGVWYVQIPKSAVGTLVPGTPVVVTVTVDSTHRDVFVVPQSAVSEGVDGPQVVTVRDGRNVPIPIKLGLSVGGWVGVTGALTEDDVVVNDVG